MCRLQCSFADCVNYKKSQEPFYLHPPSPVGGHQQQQQHNGTGRGKVAVKDGLYVVNGPPSPPSSQQQHQQQFCKVNAATVVLQPVEPVRPSPQPQGPFYLHNPNGLIDDPVKDIFATDKTAAKAAAYVTAAAPPPPPLPAIGLNTMTGKSIILLLTSRSVFTYYCVIFSSSLNVYRFFCFFFFCRDGFFFWFI